MKLSDADRSISATFWRLGAIAGENVTCILNDLRLPPELYSIWEAYPWRLGEVFCYLRQTVMELTSYASVLTITAFTVERYLAICHPLLAHKISALSRAVKIIISIWIVSLLMAIPYAAHTRLYKSVYIPGTDIAIADSLVCSIPYHFLEGFMYYMFQVSTFLFFIGPVTVIIILYILIGVALRRSPLNRGTSEDASYSSVKNTSGCSLPHQPRKVVIRMLVAVTVAFIVCWAPFHAQRLMVLYVPKWTPELLLVQSHIFYVSGVLYFVSSTVNPILYNVISKRYRAAFKQIIFPCCFSHPAVQTLSMARHSERYSKSQALVVLKNGEDDVRMVFRQDSADPTTTYETIPLSQSRRRTLSTDEATLMGTNGDVRALSERTNRSHNATKKYKLASNGNGNFASCSKKICEESIPVGFVCCSGNPKTSTKRINRGRYEIGDDKKDASNALRKDEHFSGGANGADVGLVKTPLRSCLRQTRSSNPENFVIENPAIQKDNINQASPLQHNVSLGATHFSSPTSTVVPLSSPISERSSLSSNVNQAVLATNSEQLGQERKLTNGRVSFQGLLTNNHTKDFV
ncbi:neuropeptide capa receptor [Plakobranchus ocellatus]|uniref:Neuropeptide capa receptor n=1 Tax=Plakobranchus ocellatus TaxID=259542 RepID=A0AAV3YRE1_9GAST|nr:neuropeptide capa receptor [Plakobranchus ocellatus]